MLSEAEQAELEALLRPLELPLEPLALLLDDASLTPLPSLAPALDASSDGLEGEESPPDAGAGPRSRPARRSSCKAQIERAQAQVAALESELEAARARSREREQQRALASARAEAPSVWKSIAERQARSRQEAEAENAHLRRLVSAQARHLRNVVALAKRRPFRNEIDAQIRLHKGARIARETPFGHDRGDAFEFLLRSMAPEFAQVQDVHSRLSMRGPIQQGRKVLSTRESSLKHRTFEAVGWMVVPFAVADVERSFFTHLAKPRLAHPSDEYSKLVGLRGDTLQLLLATHNSEFNLRQTFCSVTRKFVQRDRTVMVTLALTEPRASYDAAPLGIKALTTIVRILRPGELLSTGEQSTSIEAHWSLRGLAADATSECDAQLFEPFVDAGLTHMLYCMTREEEAIEEILLAGGRPTDH